MSQHRVFYSWQSDHPNSTNRSFIEKALEEAVKSVQVDDSLAVDPVIDRDTLGLPGAPDIVHSIFEKIEQASIFICDVSIVSDLAARRPTPNPNVLVELGYALKALGHERVILVMNTAYGEVKKLPFDLDHRRVLTYEVSEKDTDKAIKRRELSSKIAVGFKNILAHFVSSGPEQVQTPIELLEEYFIGQPNPFAVKRLILTEVKKACEKINSLPSLEKEEHLLPEELSKFLEDCESSAGGLLDLFIQGCFEGESPYSTIWAEALSYLTECVAPNRHIDNIRLYPALLLFYAGGIAAVAGEKYGNLTALISKPKIWDRRREGHAESSASALVPYRVIGERMAKRLPKEGTNYAPLSLHLFSVLREPFRQITSNDLAYEDAFIRFEYLFALASAAKYKNDHGYTAVPVGSYVWESSIRKAHMSKSPLIFLETDNEIALLGEQWPPLHTSLFQGPLEKFLEFKKEADESLVGLIRNFYPGFPL